MRLFLIITVIAVMAVMAGCGSARNTITLRAEPLSAVIPDKKSSDDTSIEVAPLGNAALAGKPGEEEEAATHVWDFRDATTWLLGEISPSRFFDTPYSSWYVSGYRDYSPDPVIMEQLKEIDIDGYTVTIDLVESIKITNNRYELLIKVPSHLIPAKASLHNLNGSHIRTKVIDSNECSFDITGLLPGIYVVSVYNSVVQDAAKIVICQ